MMIHVYDDNDYESVVTERRADRRVPEVCAILTKLNHGNFFPFSSDGVRAQCFVKNPKKTLSLKREELHFKNPVYELLSFDVGPQYFASRG